LAVLVSTSSPWALSTRETSAQDSPREVRVVQLPTIASIGSVMWWPVNLWKTQSIARTSASIPSRIFCAGSGSMPWQAAYTWCSDQAPPEPIGASDWSPTATASLSIACATAWSTFA
jgi:hypothetical protein